MKRWERKTGKLVKPYKTIFMLDNSWLINNFSSKWNISDIFGEKQLRWVYRQITMNIMWNCKVKYEYRIQLYECWVHFFNSLATSIFAIPVFQLTWYNYAIWNTQKGCNLADIIKKRGYI